MACRRWPGVPPGIEAEQPARVRMLRVPEDVADRSRLDDPPRVHHGHAIGRAGDDAEIVGDEQQGEPERVLHLAQQVENLGLNRDVKRRRRFVGDDERGPAGEGHRDQHPLAHAARQLVGVVVHAGGRGGHAHRLEEFDRLGARIAFRRPPVDEQRLARSGRQS